MDAEDCVQETFLRWHGPAQRRTEAIRRPGPIYAQSSPISVIAICAQPESNGKPTSAPASRTVLKADPTEHVELAEIYRSPLCAC